MIPVKETRWGRDHIEPILVRTVLACYDLALAGIATHRNGGWRAPHNMTKIRSALIALTFAAAAVAPACGGSDASDSNPANAEPTTDTSIASLVTVDHISFNQGVQVTYVKGGELMTPNAPVIPARPGLIRVHATNASKTNKLTLTAELRVHRPGKEDIVLVDGPRALVRLEPSALDTTFHFELTADQVEKDATLSVEIRDPKGVDKTTAHFPVSADDAPVSMNVQAFGPTLKVKFAPVVYSADGSGRVPPLDDTVLEAHRKALYAMYPVTNVELSVREAFNWPLKVQANGDGWNALLAAVMKTRKDDRAPDDVYYVGVFNPAPTEREYCKAGCVLGVAPTTFLNMSGSGSAVSLRAAMIVGYVSERSHGTLAQELAHAMERLHAPCGNPAAIDTKYPYDGASLGTWGWDVWNKELVDPEDNSDFMSYCGPVWVSDYTWTGIYNKMLNVERTKNTPDTDNLKSYAVDAHGSLVPSGGGPKIDVITTFSPPLSAETLETPVK